MKSPNEQLKDQYTDKRVPMLLNRTKKELAEYIASLEAEIMDVADSVLDDDFPNMAEDGIHGNLDNVEISALKAMKELDKDEEPLYLALWKYRTVE